MTPSQGTHSGTRRDTDGEHIGRGALRKLLYVGGGLAAAGAILGIAGAVASTPVVWAFGLGAAAVSLTVLAVTSYHGRSQSI